MIQTPAHRRMAATLLELADTAVQLANAAAETAQRAAARHNGDDHVLYEDAMYLSAEQASIAEHMAEIAEETGDADFVSLAHAARSAIVAAADAEAIAGVDLAALKLLGLFDNPLFTGIKFEDVPEWAVELPASARKKPQPAKPAKPVKQQPKPKPKQPAAKPAPRTKTGRRFWWTLAALVIALFLI
ncbi:hypothetical protein [Streptomyces hydrogenans]|uniref:hypothetical protein n=1 Tax=Streptomyces hydrogenans TaxID=1873719 RepID=UPI0038058094